MVHLKKTPHMKKQVGLFLFVLMVTGLSLLAQTSSPRCSEASYELTGQLASNSSSNPVIQNVQGAEPKVGDMGTIDKYFEESLFGGIMTGWLSIGEGEITAIKGDQVTLKVTKKSTQVTINGKDKNLFVQGRTVKFTCYAYAKPTPVTYTWPDGKMKAEGTILCDKKLGKWTYYDEAGIKTAFETWDTTGNLNGPYAMYYPNGNLSEKGTISNDGKDGPFETFYPDGKTKLTGFLKAGLRHGKFTGYYENGARQADAEFNADVLTGNYTGYYNNGFKKEEGAYNSRGEKNGEWKYYYENTGNIESEGNYDKDMETGIWKFYNENGTLRSQIQFRSGVMDGSARYFSPNGTIETDGIMSNGQMNGLWLVYYPDGSKKEEMNYRNGTRCGASTAYHSNGKVSLTCTYDDKGKMDGEYISYDEKGKPKEKGLYNHGTKTGKWLETTSDGKKKKVTYP